MSLLLLAPQLSAHTYFAGTDSWFHANQYYDAMMQFKTGHFSYFASLFGFHRTGRIVSAFYGAGFMYLNGLLLWLAHTWYRFEIIQDFLLLITTGIIFFKLCTINHISRAISAWMSLIYMSSTPILLFLTEQEYIGLGALLVPLILIQATEIARNKLHWINLSVVMAITLQINPLSTLLGIICLLPFSIYHYCQCNRKIQFIKDILKSIGLFILLTANILYAMLNVFSQKIIPPLPQGFSNYKSALTLYLPTQSSVIGFSEFMIVLIASIVSIIALCHWNKIDNIIKITCGLGLFSLWLSSVYFPWKLLFNLCPSLKYQIQYPKRFLSLGICSILLALGMLIQQRSKELSIVHKYLVRNLLIFFSSIILSSFVFGGLINNNLLMNMSINNANSIRTIGYGPFHPVHFTKSLHYKLQTAYHSTNGDRSLELINQDTNDYLPTIHSIKNYKQYRLNGSYFYNQSDYYTLPQKLHSKSIHVNNEGLILSWYQPKTKYITLPLTKYKNTRIMVNNHVLKHPRISNVGAIKHIKVHQGENKAILKYYTPVYIKLLFGLLIMVWIIIISYYFQFIIQKIL